jgi:AraC family transcriptional regulator
MDGSILHMAKPARSAPPFRIEFDRLTINGTLAHDAADERTQTDPVLRVLVGSGRGCVLHGSDLPPMVLVPLRGSVRVADSESARLLRCGQLFIAEAGQCLQVVGRGVALWLAFVAPASVWRQLFEVTTETPFTEPLLFPAMHAADRAIRRAALRVARVARQGFPHGPDDVTTILRFATLLADLQSAFDPMIKRCPGRTLAQRRGVFLRLQRVYNWMESSADYDLRVAGFARVAKYSPCHFVRTFNTVFGETPHAVLMEHRLRRAFRLVHDTELSITEIARASGFEDRCAFARSFKRRFGSTATGVRGRTGAISA